MERRGIMRYSCGIYGGSFNPLHLGHVRCMLTAANQCEKLIVVISCGPNRGEIDIRQRYRWVYEATRHFSHIRIMVLEDPAPSKAEYTEEQWLADAQKVKDFAGEPITAVFFGSDYAADGIWAKCYPGAETVVIRRDEISSTAVRSAPLRCWHMMPDFVRYYFTKKVLLIGTESTGKTTLTVSLARHFDTVWLEEVGRAISTRSGTDEWMLPEDFTDILLQHKSRQRELLARANRVFFEDTDCLTTLFFIGFLNGPEKEKNAALAEAVSALNEYDLILLLSPDVDFVQDGDRSEVIAANREKYTQVLQALYARYGSKVVRLGGDYQQRYAEAVRLVEELITER